LVEVVCSNCGSERYIRQSLYEKSVTGIFFCDMACKTAWRKKNPPYFEQKGYTSNSLEKIKLLAKLNKELKNGGSKNEIREKYHREFGQL